MREFFRKPGRGRRPDPAGGKSRPGDSPHPVKDPDTAPRPAPSDLRAGHDFGRIPLFPWEETSATPSTAPDRPPGLAENDEALEHDEGLARAQTDDEHARAQSGGGGGGGGGGGAAAGPSATLAFTGDSYVDTATESRKNIKFNVTWKGGAKEDYVIVNWLKGYMKNPKGTPYKVMMYGKAVDFDFGSWQVDSVDEDPVYWSTPTTRWRYSVDGPNKFHATDSPRPPAFPTGAKAKVDFKTAVYKDGDVPAKTTGSISATPLTSLLPWSYHVEVLGGGKYKHKL